MRRRQREELVLDVWRSFDTARKSLNNAWVDDVPPHRSVVEQIVEDTRAEVGQQLRRALLRQSLFRTRLRPPRIRLAVDDPPTRDRRR